MVRSLLSHPDMAYSVLDNHVPQAPLRLSGRRRTSAAIALDRTAYAVTTRVLYLALCLLLTASPAVAQVLRGTVMDTTIAGPVDVVRVAVFSMAGVRIGDAVTKSDGEFTFHVPAAGDYRLHASRQGYATTITELIRVDSGSGASVVIPMVRLPLPLETVTVVARPVPATQQQVLHLVNAGFYSRQRLGFGHFLTRADIDKRATVEFAELIRGIPGIQVRCRGHEPCEVHMPGSTSMFIGKFCSPSVVLDGALLSRGGAGASGGGFDALSPFNLEAVEIYSHSTGVPVQWRTSACGAIVAWSRR